MKRILTAALAAALLAFAPIAFAQDNPAPTIVTDQSGELATVTTSATGDNTTVINTPADQPTTVELPNSDTTVILPVGNWVESLTTAIRDGVISLLGLGLLWASRLLPETIRQYINAQRIKAAEQLLAHAVDWAFNAVRGATRGMKVEVNVGSALVAEGAQYVVDNGPAWLIDWLGGVEGIQQKIAARLDLAPDVTTAQIVPGHDAIIIPGGTR